MAKEIGVPARRINEIGHGQRRITADTALRPARFFGTSERFWINRPGSTPVPPSCAPSHSSPKEPAMNHSERLPVQVSSPVGLIAVVPRLLGLGPQAGLVVIGVSPQHGRVRVAFRYDLPDLDTCR